MQNHTWHNNPYAVITGRSDFFEQKKLLQKIINNQKNVRFDDFVSIVEAFHFCCTRTEGSHAIFKNSGVSEILNIQNVNGEAKPYQVKQFLSLIERYDLEMED